MAQATPLVFRYRSLLFGLSFGFSAWLSIYLWRANIWPRSGMDRFLALDSRLWVGQRMDAPQGPLLQLVLPLACVAVCFVLRSWGTSYLRGHIMADKDMHSDRLIVAGPFRWVRNPLYLGNLFLAAAFGMLLPPPGLVLIVVSQLVVILALDRAESKGLRAVHGAAYDAYAGKVGALVPRPPRAGVPSSSVRPDWANGLWTESWHLGFAVYLVGIALHSLPILLAGTATVLLIVVRNRVVNSKVRSKIPPPNEQP